MTFCESTQETLEVSNYEDHAGEGMVQSPPRDQIKEESMRQPDMGTNEDDDDKIIISGDDVQQPASKPEDASTSDGVVTKIR